MLIFGSTSVTNNVKLILRLAAIHLLKWPLQLELNDLVKLPVAAKWKQLGVQLGVPTHKLDEIQANHEHSPNFAPECLSDMFTW